jgi:hypothetical protein
MACGRWLRRPLEVVGSILILALVRKPFPRVAATGCTAIRDQTIHALLLPVRTPGSL